MDHICAALQIALLQGDYYPFIQILTFQTQLFLLSTVYYLPIRILTFYTLTSDMFAKGQLQILPFLTVTLSIQILTFQMLTFNTFRPECYLPFRILTVHRTSVCQTFN